MKVWWGLGIGGRLARVGDSPVKYVKLIFAGPRASYVRHMTNCNN